MSSDRIFYGKEVPRLFFEKGAEEIAALDAESAEVLETIKGLR